MEGVNHQGRAGIFEGLFHEVPAILEALSPFAFKKVSATCRSLRQSFCARVSVLSRVEFADASKLSCTTWLHVVCTGGIELESQLPAQWEYMMAISLFPPLSSRLSNLTAVLVRSHQQLNAPSMNLSTQHCTVLSNFAQRYRRNANLNVCSCGAHF